MNRTQKSLKKFSKRVSKRYSKNSPGRALLLLCLTLCGMMLFEPAWTYIAGSMNGQAMAVYPTGVAPIPVQTVNPYSNPQFVAPAQPSSTPTPDLPSPTAAPELTGFYPDAAEGFLPICHGKRTGEKIVALTIDDCNQSANLQEIVRIISSHGGKGTIFPIGENVSYLAPVLRNAHAQGFEIENHTQSHSGLYTQSDKELAYQIWQQNYEVSQVLGVDYQMHFLRPRGGDNRYDQRTHAYMRQMGYYGMAYWTQEGSLSTADEIMSKLKQGDIILFHTTNYDLSVIRELVPRLHAAGYRMVTLNEMFEIPENEEGILQPEATVMPLAPYDRINQIIRRGEYLHDVLLIQQRLVELGYYTGKCDGCFGEITERALMRFQRDAGLEQSGVCDVATWNALFAN